MVTFQSVNGWSVTGTIEEYYTNEAGQLIIVMRSAGGVFTHFPADMVTVSVQQ